MRIYPNNLAIKHFRLKTYMRRHKFVQRKVANVMLPTTMGHTHTTRNYHLPAQEFAQEFEWS